MEEALRILAEERKKNVQSKIDSSTETAVDVINRLAESEDIPPAIQLAAAKDILDRGGFKAVDRQIVAHTFPKPIIDIEALQK